MERLITNKQLSKLHTLLSQSGMTDNKRQLVFEVSGRRTVSSKELTYKEVVALIEYLEDILGTEKVRRKIFALAYEAEIIYGHTAEDKKMNTAKLNRFLAERGAVKKELNKMNKQELLQVVKQFASIVKHNSASNHSKNVKSLLEELNLNVK